MPNEISITELLPYLELDEFISIDLETTGLNPDLDKITEISACRFKKGVFIDDYTTLVNPEILIPKNITNITGISNKMVKDAPIIDSVMPELLNFIKDKPLVAQNIKFDHTFLNKFSHSEEFLIGNILYDTLSLARAFIYYHNSFSLGSLCDYYEINVDGMHRAKTDALCTGKIFVKLIKEVLSKPLSLVQRIDELYSHAEIYNSTLFKNIIKTSVKYNVIDGLVKSKSSNVLSKNYYQYNSNNTTVLVENPKDWFDENGAISLKWNNFEKRASQMELVKDSYDAFTKGNILVAEAGTGLGKSLSYLSSGFLASKHSNKSLVISTYTKNLQDQLFNEDIPQFSNNIDQDLIAVIYKGRDNYVCKTRLSNLLQNYKILLQPFEYEKLLPILVWEWETKSGDINECNGFKVGIDKKIWSLIKSERGYCTTNRCSKYDGCFLGKLRMKINEADIIIINHSLFASELFNDLPSLPKDFIYIVDEAHHFSQVARDQLVTQIGSKSFDDIFTFFSTKKNNWRRNIINRFPKILELYNRISSAGKLLKNNLDDFFNSYYDCKNEIINKTDYNKIKLLYMNSEDEFIDSEPSPWDILNDLGKFVLHVQEFGEMIQEKNEQISLSFLSEFNAINTILKDGVKNFNVALETQSDLVRWSTFTKLNYNNITELNSAPLNVNKLINEKLLSQYSGGLFCSATLMINDDFRYFNEKIGLDLAVLNQNIIEKVYNSPFHYNEQVRLFVFNNNINVNDSLYIKEVAQQIERIFTSLEKRMLVLCTSYKQTAELNNYIKPKLNEKKYKLYTQAPGVSKNALVSGFLKNPNSILIGTSSFWEGVDFPGDKVEILYIVKTPFDNPFEPLVQAQIQNYNNNGIDPFINYQVPEAAMKIRQGFGRLIRSMNDSGICIIADTRLYKKQYGKIILDSFPVESQYYNSVDSLISQSQKFF